MTHIHPLTWKGGELVFLDQTLLPREERYVSAHDVATVAEAIRALRIRGAPLIGVAAAYGTVLSALSADSAGSARARVSEAIQLLRSTRPTAVNLFAALARMEGVLNHVDERGDLARCLLAEANAIEREDGEACRRIGEFGASLLSVGSSVLTHCNAGALATAGIGTAIGIITTAHAQGKIVRVYADETRPLLQGARLTAWELSRAGIATFLITDSTAGVVLSRGMVQAVIVGADRIAANGDTANKIGTYSVAVLARRHNVPFYVAAPMSTVDLSTPTGESIAIEERDPAEVLAIGGHPIAPEGVGAFSPAFDVTPNELITAIVTNCGIVQPPLAQGLAKLLVSR